MTPLSRLRELAARSTQIKEFGILTKNEASYDKNGTFTGIENHYNGPGIAEAAGGAALVGAGLGAGHVGIMKKYGTGTIRREKGRFIKPKQVSRTVGGAYKAAGSDALGALKRVVGKRFSAKLFSGNSNLFRNLPDDWHRSGKMVYSSPEDHRGEFVKYKKPVRIHRDEVFESKYFPNSSMTSEEPIDYSPSRVRRAKAAGGMIAAAGAGYFAGKHSKSILSKVAQLKGKHLSAKDRLKELAGGYAMKEGDINTIYKEPGVKGHLKRHAGLYISAPLALPSLGIAPLIGAGVDSMRRDGNILKTHIDSINPLVPKLPKNAAARASHRIYGAGDGTMAYIPLSAKDRLKELARGDYLIKHTKSWAKKQKPDVQAMMKQGMKFPGVKEMLRRDPEALAEKLPGMPVGMAHDMVRDGRIAVAQRYRHEKASGLYNATGLNVHQVMRHQAGAAIADSVKDVDLAGELKSMRKSIKKSLSAKDRLKELADASSAIKSFDDRRDENGHPIVDKAVGAGLGAGAVLGHQAIMKKYGNGVGGLAGAKQAYGAAGSDLKAGFSQGFNPPSTSAGSGMVATPGTNSPLSHDTAKVGGIAPSVDAAHGVGGTAKVVESAGADVAKASPLFKAGAKAGGLGAAIRGFLSRLR